MACLADKESWGEIFNIAYGRKIYLNDLYFKICELLEINIQPIYSPERPGDIKHSNADISKAENILGFHPEYDIHRGSKKAIERYKGNL